MAERQTRALRRALAAGILLLIVPGPGIASPETLRRSAGNILLAPLDLALSPVVAGLALHRNLGSTEDPTAVRVVFALPGYAWLTGVQLGAAVVREVAGLLELLPGVALCFFEPDLDALFEPAERGPALVDIETPLRLRFGIDYTTTPE